MPAHEYSLGSTKSLIGSNSRARLVPFWRRISDALVDLLCHFKSVKFEYLLGNVRFTECSFSEHRGLKLIATRFATLRWDRCGGRAGQAPAKRARQRAA